MIAFCCILWLDGDVEKKVAGDFCRSGKKFPKQVFDGLWKEKSYNLYQKEESEIKIQEE